MRLALTLSQGFMTIVVLYAQCTLAQSTDAQCEPYYGWMFNTRGQNPCLIAAYLYSPCAEDPSAATVPALGPDEHYVNSGPNQCDCNTVLYSLISACAVCQGRTLLNWTDWKMNCTAVSVSQYPEAIPYGTSVPAWAYMFLPELVGPGYWNANAAQAFKAQNDTEFPIDQPTTPTSSLAPGPPTAVSATSEASTAAAPSVPSVFSRPPLSTPSPAPVSVPTSSPMEKSNAGSINKAALLGMVCVVLLAFDLLA